MTDEKRDPIFDYHCIAEPDCACQVHAIARAAVNREGITLNRDDTLVIATLLNQAARVHEALREKGLDFERRAGGRIVIVTKPAAVREH